MKKDLNASDAPLMTTHRQRFAFVLRFAAMDLQHMRPGDWLNVRWELRDFLLPIHASLAPGGVHLHPTAGPDPDNYPVDLLRALQGEVQDMLQMVIASRANPQAWVPKYVTLGLSNPHVPALPTPRPGRHLMSVEGTTRDVFLFSVADLLARIDTSALTRCPECDVIFVRKSNQSYCSKRCQNRTTQRRWRERQAEGATHRGTKRA
jgi:hypothetical protein